jgi:transcriptional regulator of arginine metabolism
MKSLDQVILQLLDRHSVADQDLLLGLLAKQGFALTQSTLSRHLKKLHVQKADGVYRRLERPAPARPGFTLAEAPPNLVVLRTEPGFANALALKLDDSGIPGLVGTIAGDDTVFIAVDGPSHLRPVHDAVRRRLTEGG